MIRVCLSISCVLFSWSATLSPADEPRRSRGQKESVDPVVCAVLREASELALKQDRRETYWVQGVLLQISDVQIRAGDYDGALRSIRGSDSTACSYSGLCRLAEALAHAGNRERAFDVWRLAAVEDASGQDSLKERISLRWFEHLVFSGDLDSAGKAVDQIKDTQYRFEALRMLAVAHVKSGDQIRAGKFLTLSLDAASNSPGDLYRAWTLWEFAGAQQAVGNTSRAMATIRQLIDTIDSKDSWARISALREAAVVSAQSNDRQAARRLFHQAIEAVNTANPESASQALGLIGQAQAGVGYRKDARKTVALLSTPVADNQYRVEQDKALFKIAAAQAQAEDVEGAIQTAIAIKYCLQFRDDALHVVVDRQIQTRDLKTTLATAGNINNPSRKAEAILKIATAYARSGDRTTATDLAARIDLTASGFLPEAPARQRFDYRHPPSWGVLYDANGFGTMASFQREIARAAGVAAAAMSLAQALRQKPDQSYAVLFNEIRADEIIEALARAHAVAAAANDDLSWAAQIGSNGKDGEAVAIAVRGTLAWAWQMSSTGFIRPNEYGYSWAVQHRVHALIGVASGILDRSIGGMDKQRPR